MFFVKHWNEVLLKKKKSYRAEKADDTNPAVVYLLTISLVNLID